MLKYYKNLQKEYQNQYSELYVDYYTKEEKSISNRKIYRLIPINRVLDIDFGVPKADLVFVKEDGRFDGTDSMKYVAKIAKNELKVKFQLKLMRRGHGTTLYENGASLKDIQARLGHGDSKVTMDSYIVDTETMENSTVSIFENVGELKLSNSKIVKYEF